METSITSIGMLALLGLGLLFGLKHAIEVDHVMAVSSIVSAHRSVWRSALVGGLWGAGHTASLVIVGVLVLVFRISIPLSLTKWLEFGVALMIIGLGVTAVLRVLRTRQAIHLHVHKHDGTSHAHIHFHEDGTEHGYAAVSNSSHSHVISQLGLKPVLVGALHGLAGSAAITLLVLTQIPSILLGLLYLGVFGVGSTVGMLIMSGLIGVPFALSGHRFGRLNSRMQTIAGSLSIVIGILLAYQVGLN